MFSNNLIGRLTRGMVAGAVGTIAMTVSERLEMAVSGRQASTVPGQVGAHLLPRQDPSSSTDIERLNTPVHWVHGISMGALRGVLDQAGLRGLPASAAHFALLWGGDAALYRALGIAPAPWVWRRSELAVDLLHKGVHADVSGVVYERLAA